MPYIGKAPVSGGFHKLDALTASATATYALTLGSAAYFPETANQLLVSLNGVIQAPQDSFTVSGSSLVFDSALTSSDSIDFVVALGDVLGVQGVTDGAVTTNKIANGAVTDAKINTMAASKLTGALPAISGAALTGITPPLVGSPIALSGLSNKTFTGIPAGTNRFTVVLDDVSGPSNGYLKLQLGTSSGIETGGVYLTIDSNGTGGNFYAYGNGTANDFRMTAWSNDNANMSGTVTFTHFGSNKWMVGAHLFSRQYLTYFVSLTGQVNLSAECTQVKVFPATGNFDAGSVNLLLG